MARKIKAVILWLMTPEDGGSMVLRNFGNLWYYYVDSQTRGRRIGCLFSFLYKIKKEVKLEMLSAEVRRTAEMRLWIKFI